MKLSNEKKITGLRLALLTALGAGALVPMSASAAYYWACDEAESNWDDTCWISANSQPSSSASPTTGAPVSSQTVFLTSTDYINRTIHYRNSNPALSLLQVRLDSLASSADQFLMTLSQSQDALNLSASGDLIVGMGNSTAAQIHTGAYVQNGGSVNFLSGGNLYLGYNANAVGKYTLNAGTLNLATASADVGYSGQGIFLQHGGVVNGSSLILGHNAGAQGRYELSNGDVNLAYSLTVGNTGQGTFMQSGGNVAVNELQVRNGSYSLTNGSLHVSSASASSAIGSGGASASFTQSGGTHSVTNRLIIGWGSGSDNTKGTYNLNGGTLQTGSTAVGVGTGATGTFNQTSGTHVTDALYVSASLSHGAGQGVYNLSGGLLDAGSITLNPTLGTFNFTGGRLEVDTFNGNLTNNGGTFALGDGNTTLINGDFLQLAGITEVVLDHHLTGNNNATLDAGEAYLRLAANKTIDLGGSLHISLTSGLDFAIGDTFDLMGATTINCLFCDANGAFNFTEANGLNWTVNLLADAKGTTDILRLTINALPSTVPVPAAVWLFGSGLIGLIGLARRKA